MVSVVAGIEASLSPDRIPVALPQPLTSARILVDCAGEHAWRSESES